MRISISELLHGHSVTIAPVLALAAGVCGCVLGDHERDPGLFADEYELVMPNGLLSNGLPTNGLPTNGLPTKDLPTSGLPDSALSANGLASEQINQEWEDWLGDPERGATNDLLMTYIVRCALGSGESSSYTDSLGNTWTWHGELGVAPAWATGAITASQARWVTSCVLSLVNGSGLSVQISVRGPSSSAYTVTTTELLGYPNLEGAFFGDMFASTPVYYSCHGDFWDAASGRICTRNGDGGSSSCAPIQPRGGCASVCSTEPRSWLSNSYDVFHDCTGADALTYSEVTTTVLAPL